MNSNLLSATFAAELVADAPCGIVVTDAVGKILFQNATLLSWLKGGAKNAAIREDLASLLTPAGKLLYETRLSPIMTLQGRVDEVSCMLAVDDRSQFPVLLTGVARRGADNTVLRCDYTIFDSRERKKYEDQLRFARREADELASIVRVSPDALFRVGADGVVHSWNGAAEQHFGLTAKEAIDSPVEQVVGLRADPGWFATETSRGGAQAMFSAEHQDGRAFDVMLSRISETHRLASEQDWSISMRDVSARRDAEHRLRIVLGEMKHRLKNTFSVVAAIARQTLSAEENQAFMGRIQSLSKAHDLLVASQWHPVNLRQVLDVAVAEAGGPERLVVTASKIALAADQTTSLALVLHELVTNAFKYGALSVPGGHVTLDCRIDQTDTDERMAFTWREKNGPTIQKPDEIGFGSWMINALFAAGDSRIDFDFRPEGLVFNLDVKLEKPSDQASTTGL